LVEIEEEKFEKLIEALKKATHKDFDQCQAEVCEEIAAALKAVGRL
jgi:hypothetical protein